MMDPQVGVGAQDALGQEQQEHADAEIVLLHEPAWLRDRERFGRCFADMQAAGLGSVLLHAHAAAFWVCDDEPARDLLNELFCAQAEAEGIDADELLWAMRAAVRPDREPCAYAHVFGRLVALEAAGVDTRAAWERLGAQARRELQRRWVVEARAVRARRHARRLVP